jgi:two-component system chemotaxis sensor kinase CheA
MKRFCSLFWAKKELTLEIIDQIKQTFIDEAEELLSELEGLLLDLETNPEDKSQLDAVFRVMHTIKGSAGMVGEDKIYQFAHMVEDVFDSIRNGVMSFSSDVANLALESRDIILSLINDSDPDVDSKISIIEEKLGKSGKSGKKAEKAVTAAPPAVEKTYNIKFFPDEDIFKRGSNPLLIIQELQSLGTLTIDVDDAMLPSLDELQNDKCYIGWNLFLTTDKSYAEVKDVFLFVEADCAVAIEESPSHLSAGDDVAKIGEILIDRGVVTPSAVNEILEHKKKIGEELIDQNIVSRGEVETALLEQEHLKKIQSKHAATQNIKISTDKLDDFVNLVGELVTLQAQLNQHSLNTNNYELVNIAESLQRLSEELRDSVLGIRMIPVGQTFGVFKRLVRDLSGELGKKINLVTVGEETELDKSVLDKLKEPLVHIIRNCIDHGIETPDLRRAAGKDEAGTIKLSAEHSGGLVYITIQDDGKGIKRETIRKKAIERGLIDQDDQLTDEKLYSLVFQSGFSTAESVSKVSGRGVGMDVVKKEIENLQGSVILSSEEDKGTKIIISLPLTLAIIDGLLVKVEDDHYILPLSSIEACIDRNDAEEKKEGNKNIIHYRDMFLPYMSLRNLLTYKSKPPVREQIVVVNTENTKYGLVVDEVIGDYQTVIKNLGKVFNNAKTFSGATILGDGRIALILNINNLIKTL